MGWPFKNGKWLGVYSFYSFVYEDDNVYTVPGQLTGSQDSLDLTDKLKSSEESQRGGERQPFLNWFLNKRTSHGSNMQGKVRE